MSLDVFGRTPPRIHYFFAIRGGHFSRDWLVYLSSARARSTWPFEADFRYSTRNEERRGHYPDAYWQAGWSGRAESTLCPADPIRRAGPHARPRQAAKERFLNKIENISGQQLRSVEDALRNILEL
jgi:hypothetical protein